jgi:hypothetical protein
MLAATKTGNGKPFFHQSKKNQPDFNHLEDNQPITINSKNHQSKSCLSNISVYI